MRRTSCIFPFAPGIFALGMVMALAVPREARAQGEPVGYEVDYAIDGTVTGVALGGAALMTLMPVDTKKRWSSELLGSFDLGVRSNFSTTAAKLSDALVAATVATPVLVQLDRGIDGDAGKRLLLYGESISITLAANAVTKYLVQRPRPYNYNPDPRVMAYAREAGKDSHTSFYSGHSAISFTAAMTGSYLFALGSTDNKAKAAIWMLEFTLATATANLRVRAGKHYYSDIMLGAVLGCAVGYLVPALHADERGAYTPSGLEIGAMAGGVVLGGLVSQLLPIDKDIAVPLAGSEGGSGGSSGGSDAARTGFTLMPMALQDGGGVAAIGLF